MLLSLVEPACLATSYPEIAGARVLVTGATPEFAAEFAAAFGRHRARMIIQTLGPVNGSITAPIDTGDAGGPQIDIRPVALPSAVAAVRFTQDAVQALGGLDAVINLVTLGADDLAKADGNLDVEDFVSDTLLPATMMTRVAANRMRVTWTDGHVLNVLAMPEPATGRQAALADVVRAALAAMTRAEARDWATASVRVNAVAAAGQNDDGVATTAEDVAAIALYLSSKGARNLSGHMFDAAGVSHLRC